MTTYEQAYDDMLAIFVAAWTPTGHPVSYENVASDPAAPTPPSSATPWARVTLRTATGQQASLTGGLGTARYERTGTLIVQVFTPAGEGLSRSQQLSKIVTDAFEGVASPNQVWFRNARVNEIGPDGDWFQVNVLVDFTYDEIR